jgi:hypothetical protein
MHVRILAAGLAAALATSCVPYDAARDDEGFSVKDKKKDKDKRKDKDDKKDHGADEDEPPPAAPAHTGKPGKKAAFAARWLDEVTRDKCEAGALVLDRMFEVSLAAPEASAGPTELTVNLEMCGPAGPSLPDGGKLRLVWAKGPDPIGETSCDLPDVPAGHLKGPENPAPITCPGNIVKLTGPGDYGLDVYLGDVLLRESRFQVVSVDMDGRKVLSIDKRLRYLEAWLGVRTDKDGWAERSGLEIRLPSSAHDTIIHTWFRDGKTIRKAREATAADIDGDRVWLEGPKIENLAKDGDYEVNVAVAGTAARTAFFSVKKGKLSLHPKQEESATRRVLDRYLLVEVTVHGFASGAEAIPPATLATYGLYGKGW